MVDPIHGISSLNKAFAQTTKAKQTAMERMASGKRINSAKDDAARLATIQQFLSIEAGAARGAANMADGQSLARTAEGALGSQSEALGRMRELAVQAQNGTLNDQDRATIQQEYDQLAEEITRVSESTEFNGKKLLDGSAQGADKLEFADGSNDADIDLEIEGHSAADLGVEGRDVASAATVDAIDQAIDEVSNSRAELGTFDRRLDHKIANLRNKSENIAAARSRIEDADYALEMSHLTRARILEDSALALRAGADRIQRDSVLKLLR